MAEQGTGQDIILIVDDEPEIGTALQDVLVREGYRVIAVTNGKAAVEMMAQHAVTLVLLDLHMPGISGLDLMSHIRQRWPYTVIVILTGHGSLNSALVALRQGAHDYLLKPAAPDEIKASIRKGLEKRHQIIRRKSLINRIEASVRELTDTRADADVLTAESTLSPSTAPVRANNLVVDLQRHRATLDGKALLLTPTEFNTLFALVRNSGRVVSYAELVEKTHGYKCSAQEAQTLIKTHISHLRQKLRAHTQNPCPIVNVRGVGYMWDQSNES